MIPIIDSKRQYAAIGSEVEKQFVKFYVQALIFSAQMLRHWKMNLLNT